MMEERNKENEQAFAIHNVSHSAILNVCRKQLDMPVHKVKYALTEGLLNGAFKSLENYGIELNRESFGIFYDAVSAKLSGSKEVEYEWTEKEYDAMMQIRSFVKTYTKLNKRN
jgi:hypothetical protein